MEVFFGLFRWFWRVIFVSTFIIGIIGACSDFLETITLFGLSGLHLAFILLGLSSLVVIGQLSYHLYQHPHLVLYKTENVLGNVRTFSNGVEKDTEHPYFSRIQIANDPKNSLQSQEARRVVAHISFLDKQHTQFFQMIGRWAETKEIATGGEPLDIDQIDIPPNGRPYILDIGLKYHDEDEFYGYNNDTPRKSTIGFRDKDRVLPPGTYVVKVRLRGILVDEKFNFVLINEGRGKEITLS